MHHTLGMRVSQTARGLQDVVNPLQHGHSPLMFDKGREVLAIDKFHD